MRQVVVVPDHINMVLESGFRYEYGTNCWNATKHYFEPTTRIEHTHQFEMVEWLQRNTQDISERDVQIGDIAVYVNGDLNDSNGMPGPGLVHTAVVIAPSLKMFHKRGVSGNYEIVSCDEVNATYCAPYRSRLTWRRYVGPQTQTKAA